MKSVCGQNYNLSTFLITTDTAVENNYSSFLLKTHFLTLSNHMLSHQNLTCIIQSHTLPPKPHPEHHFNPFCLTVLNVILFFLFLYFLSYLSYCNQKSNETFLFLTFVWNRKSEVTANLWCGIKLMIKHEGAIWKIIVVPLYV